jgi:PAS domain S-box-containing protein
MTQRDRPDDLPASRDHRPSTDDAIREEARRYRSSFELAPVGLAHVSLGGECLAANRRLAAFVGLSAAELVGRRLQELTHPEDMAADLDRALRFFAGEVETYSRVKRYRHSGGHFVWARVTATLVRDGAGAPFYAIASMEPLSDLERDEAERQAAELAVEAERLRYAVEAANDGLWDWNVVTGDAYFSPRWCRILGYEPGEVEPHVRAWERLIHPDDRELVRRALDAHLSGQAPVYEMEHRLRRRDGSWAWVSAWGKVVVRDAASRPRRFVGTHTDVSDRKAAEAALAASETQLRGMFVHSSLPTAVYYPDGRFAQLNPAFERLWGVGLNDVAADYRVTTDPQLADLDILAAVRHAFDGSAVVVPPIRYDASRASGGLGHSSWVRAHFYPVFDDDGGVERIVQVSEDVTAHVAAEQALAAALGSAEVARAEAERASRAKTEFLARMSHELRTPLNAIQGYAQILELGAAGPVTVEQQAHLSRIQHSQRHLLRLITDVLDYAKVEAGHVAFDIRPVRLATVIAEVLPMVTPQATARPVSLLVDDAALSALVLADAAKLGQVVLNILANAVKFTPPGGRVIVDGSMIVQRAEQPGVAPVMAELRISDTGPGIPQRAHATIFDPFVQIGLSAERQPEGTGLGLAISRDLIRGMGGDIRLESEPGAGAVFIVTLPLAPA